MIKTKHESEIQLTPCYNMQVMGSEKQQARPGISGVSQTGYPRHPAVSTEQPELPEPNPVTQAAYKKQVRTEILLPFGLVLLLTLILVIILTATRTGNTSVWADVAIVFISIPFLILGLLFLAVFIAIVFGLYKVLDYLPSITVQGQDLTLQLKHYALRISDRMADPVITIDSIGKAIRGAIRSISSIFRRR
jgi:hypothetical protein